MQLPTPLFAGRLLRRYKRFLADVELADGTIVTAHTPNTGSMMQCAVPGFEVLLSAKDDPKRKLKFTLELIRVNGYWVDTHTQRSNRIVEEALRQGAISEFRDYHVSREYCFGASRIDFYLEKGEERVLLEVKNVTLCDDAVARFPDAVTKRGQKHLQELKMAVQQGWRGVIFYLVQRGEATSFSPADEIDGEYGRLLREVVSAGVEAVAYRTLTSDTENRVAMRIPVILD
ncbi:DNA/RNA nuclease SfsA [Geopsychrobacter electrodiphilus]|uniref:DNA/RNA nuclease SfsA n=1 Tax=Geopsychrobacter electrodiphilus TaxID=225196 RepID=UPI00036B2D47